MIATYRTLPLLALLALLAAIRVAIGEGARQKNCRL
jgi:hypothetical protein